MWNAWGIGALIVHIDFKIVRDSSCTWIQMNCWLSRNETRQGDRFTNFLSFFNVFHFEYNLSYMIGTHIQQFPITNSLYGKNVGEYETYNRRTLARRRPARDRTYGLLLNQIWPCRVTIFLTNCSKRFSQWSANSDLKLTLYFNKRNF